MRRSNETGFKRYTPEQWERIRRTPCVGCNGRGYKHDPATKDPPIPCRKCQLCGSHWFGTLLRNIAYGAGRHTPKGRGGR